MVSGEGDEGWRGKLEPPISTSKQNEEMLNPFISYSCVPYDTNPEFYSSGDPVTFIQGDVNY